MAKIFIVLFPNSVINKELHFLRFEDKKDKTDMQNVLRTIEIWIDNYEKENPPNPL